MIGLSICVTPGSRTASGPPLAITGAPVTTGTDGAAYAGFTATASGGTAPYTYSLVGTWPTGISINSSTGAVSGTPTQSGSFTGLSVRVTDAAAATADLSSFTLTVAAADALVASGANTNGTFSSISLGSASATRKMIVQITWANSAATTQANNITSVTLTVDGVGDVVGQLLYASATPGYRNIEYWGFDVPSGTSGTLTCVGTAGMDRWSMVLYALYSLPTLTPAASGTGSFLTCPSLTMPANSFMLAAKTSSVDATARTFTNMDNIYASPSTAKERHGYKYSAAGEVFQPAFSSTGGSTTSRNAAAVWVKS